MPMWNREMGRRDRVHAFDKSECEKAYFIKMLFSFSVIIQRHSLNWSRDCDKWPTNCTKMAHKGTLLKQWKISQY